MKKYHLEKAYTALSFLLTDLLNAHTDAAESGNQFAEIVTLGLVAQAKAMQQPIEQALIAAGGEL